MVVEALVLGRLPVRDDQHADVRLALADDDRAVDQRVAHQRILDRLRRDVLAARRLEERLLAVGYPEEPVGVDLADVAGVDPAVAHGVGGRLRIVVISQHVARAADEDLAIVGDLQLHAGERLPDAEELVVRKRVARRPGRHLGHPPAVEDRHAHRPEELLDLA